MYEKRTRRAVLKNQEASRAFGLALGVLLVAVTRALVLVAVGAGGHALALGAADVAVLGAPRLHLRLRAPRPALALAECWLGEDRLHEDGGQEKTAEQQGEEGLHGFEAGCDGRE